MSKNVLYLSNTSINICFKIRREKENISFNDLLFFFFNKFDLLFMNLLFIIWIIIMGIVIIYGMRLIGEINGKN